MLFLNTILNIIFPQKCIVCSSRGQDLCTNCLLESTEAQRESMSWIYPLYDYRHPPIKKSLWLLKYKGKKGLANIFAEAMYGRILEELSDLRIMENFHNALLIPIPLSKKRNRERGYNQALLICEALVNMDKNENFQLEKNLLVKTSDEKHQSHIENRRERLQNILGSFGIKDTEENINKIKNRNIILIDDITTTGATLNEARKILKQAGARKVIAFTVAH